MDRKRQRDNSSNRGYSLIELIVTILISSIILVSVVGFLTTGLRHYWNVNSETRLQTESQAAELFITELFQESTDFRALDSTSYPEKISYAVEIRRDAKYYILALTEGELWYSEVTTTTEEGAETSDADRLNELINKKRANAFLAKYVDSFKIGGIEGNDTFAKATAQQGFVDIEMNFMVDSKEYYSHSLVSLRNTKKN